MSQSISLAGGTVPGELPETIAGVDIKLGLELVSGKHTLYLSLLRKFLDGHRHSATAIHRALAAGDREAAELLAHNLKGVAGCIGATGLMTCAADLEQAIRTGSAECEPLLGRFAAALAEIVTDLETKLP